jgi:hypothetical protein
MLGNNETDCSSRPPYSSMEEGWKDIPRQPKRGLKKRLGLAASADVKTLSILTKSLLDLLPPTMQVPSMVISYPPIPALYNEDIVDTTEHLGIQAQYDSHYCQPREIVAAFAGNGMGLCQHPAERERCYQEGRKMPLYAILHVEYAKHALVLHARHLQTAFDSADSDINVSVLWDMGSGNCGEDYLVNLQKHLEDFVERYLKRFFERIGDMEFEPVLLITGDRESVMDGDVQEILYDAVQKVADKPVHSFIDDTEFVAARGAAELCARGRLLESVKKRKEI